MTLSLHLCMLCRVKRTQVYGARFCPECYYPGLDKDWETYEAYREEGHSEYAAKIMAGLADPQESVE